MVGQVLFIKLAEGLVTCFVHQGVDFEETRVSLLWSLLWLVHTVHLDM